MTFCEDLNVISLGLRDGEIHNYILNIEVDKDAEPEEASNDIINDKNTGDEYFEIEQAINDEGRPKTETAVLIKRAFEQIDDNDDDDDDESAGKRHQKTIQNQY